MRTSTVRNARATVRTTGLERFGTRAMMKREPHEECDEVFSCKKRQNPLYAMSNRLGTGVIGKRWDLPATLSAGNRSQEQNFTDENGYVAHSRKEIWRLSLSANFTACSESESSTSEDSSKTCSAEKARILSLSASSSICSEAGNSKKQDDYRKTYPAKDRRPTFFVTCRQAGSSKNADDYKTSPAEDRRCSLSASSSTCSQVGSKNEDDYKIHRAKDSRSSRSANSSQGGSSMSEGSCNSTCAGKGSRFSSPANSSICSQAESSTTDDDSFETCSGKEERASPSANSSLCRQSDSLTYEDSNVTHSLERKPRRPHSNHHNKPDWKQHSPHRRYNHPAFRKPGFIPSSYDQAQNSRTKGAGAVPNENLALHCASEKSGFVPRKSYFSNFDRAQNWKTEQCNSAQEYESKRESNCTRPSEKTCKIPYEESGRCNQAQNAKPKNSSSALEALMALEKLLYGNPKSPNKSDHEGVSKEKVLQCKSSDESNNLTSCNDLNKISQQSRNPKTTGSSSESSQVLIAVDNSLPEKPTSSKQAESAAVKNAVSFSDKTVEKSVLIFPGSHKELDESRMAELPIDAYTNKAYSTGRQLNRKSPEKTEDSEIKKSITVIGGVQSHLTTKDLRLVFCRSSSEFYNEIQNPATGKPDGFSDGNQPTTETAGGCQTHTTTEESCPVFCKGSLKSGLQAITTRVEMSKGIPDSSETCLTSRKTCLDFSSNLIAFDQERSAKLSHPSGSFQTVLTTENSRLVYSKKRLYHKTQNQAVRSTQNCKQTGESEVKSLIHSTRSQFEEKLLLTDEECEHTRKKHKLKRFRSDTVIKKDEDAYKPFENELVRIISTPSESGGFPCLWCKKVFSSTSSQRRHTVRHLNENEKVYFSCSFCHRKFIRKDRLKRHGLVHRNDRPHPCNRCGMRFKYRNNLARHEKRDSCFKIREAKGGVFLKNWY